MEEKSKNLIEWNDQVSQGDLKKDENEKVVVEEENKLLYKLVKKTLPISRIKNFPDFPDFVTPSHLESPLILKDGDKTFCLDGWDKIFPSEENMKCLVIEKIIGSSLDIAFAKFSSRTKTLGGECSYAEKMLGIRTLLEMVFKDNPSLQINSHGGARKGANFHSSKDADAVAILEKESGLNRNSILKYINYSRYIHPETLKILVKEKASKDFFETMASVCLKFTKKLEEESLSKDEITEKTSQKFLEEWGAWNEKKTISKNKQKNTPTATPSDEQDEDDETPSSDALIKYPPKTEKYWAGNNEVESSSLSLDKVVEKLIQTCKELIKNIENVSDSQIVHEETKKAAIEIGSCCFDLESLKTNSRQEPTTINPAA